MWAPKDRQIDEPILLNVTERFLSHEQLDAAVVVERLGLELEGDRGNLAPDVAGVVAESRRLYLLAHDLLGVALRVGHAARAAQVRQARGPLVDLIQDGSVVPDVCDWARHQLRLLVLDAGNLPPALQSGDLIRGCARARLPITPVDAGGAGAKSHGSAAFSFSTSS